MPRSTIGVRRASAADHDTVVTALARAFDDDPVVGYLLRQDERRSKAYSACFSTFFRFMFLPHDEVWMEEEGRGAALWAPPGHADVRLGAALSMGPALIGAVGLGRLWRSARGMGRVQKVHPTSPHYYLFALGVDPRHQGRGIGSAMLATVLERCDTEGVGAYLEASTAASARLYARSGFVGEAEFRMAEDAPPLWPMWRAPRSQTSTAGSGP